jgi:hypothetical protein
VHFGRFLNKDDHGRRMSADISSEKAKQSCSAAAASAEIRLDRQLQAWWDNPSWTDEPPEIKVSTLCGTFFSLYRDCFFTVALVPNLHRIRTPKNVLERPIDFVEFAFVNLEAERMPDVLSRMFMQFKNLCLHDQMFTGDCTRRFPLQPQSEI